jgi:hypothetical protein
LIFFSKELLTTDPHFTNVRLKRIEKQIRKTKEELLQIEEIRPGTLTKQYRNPKDKKGPFYQISYTYKMKGKSEYVRPHHVAALRLQIVPSSVLISTDFHEPESTLKCGQQIT